MDRTVREHILELQSLANNLITDLLHTRRPDEQRLIEGRLRAIDAALNHFRAALEIELILTEDARHEAVA